MMIDSVVFTRLTPASVAEIIAQLKTGRVAADIANPAGLPDDGIAYVDALVQSNVHTRGPVFFRGETDYKALLKNCLAGTPEQTIGTVSESGLRGYGGAGFRTGLKWQLCRAAPGDEKYVICNADEGEPGTFKDRALLTRSPRDVFMGMVIAAYAIGSTHGIVYLRAEYVYLKRYLEGQLQQLRDDGLLGSSVGGRPGFDFDIRIQMGAGSYVCGEESALIESCEGKRGTPRLKPPFPVHAGYLGKPTCVNNVETFAAATRVIEEGAEWFRRMGTPDSAGTRLLSVAGDCDRPGVYEIEWGITLAEVLAMVGARDARAVQISGPSGECLSVAGGRRTPDRLRGRPVQWRGSPSSIPPVTCWIASRTTPSSSHDESCGICVPCRAGTVDLHDKVELVMAGRATEEDLDDVAGLGCGGAGDQSVRSRGQRRQPPSDDPGEISRDLSEQVAHAGARPAALVRSQCCPRRVRHGRDRAGDGRDRMTIRIEIDGEPVATDEDRVLVDVAAEAGVYIPTLCYLKGKPCLGTCRVCSVKVNGAVVAACTVRVSDGMKVEVDEPETADIRKALVELLFAEGNHNCPSCEKSGRCTLQAVGYEVDMLVSRFPYRFPHRERDHASDKIWLERDRCIFCQRCVEFVRDEATGQKIFSISHRGAESRIEVDTERANAMPEAQVRYAVEICPVGAILEKGVGFDVPIGRRKYEVRSVRQRALDASDEPGAP